MCVVAKHMQAYVSLWSVYCVAIMCVLQYSVCACECIVSCVCVCQVVPIALAILVTGLYRN